MSRAEALAAAAEELDRQMPDASDHEFYLALKGATANLVEGTYRETLHPRSRVGRWIKKLSPDLPETIKADQQHVDGLVGRLEGFSHAGLSLTGPRITRHANGGEIQWGVDGDPEGVFRVSVLTNTLTGTTVANLDNVALGEEHQGKGFATALLGKTFEALREQGVDEVSLSAVAVGGYAWARAGFLFERPSSPQSVLAFARTDGRLDEIKRHIPDDAFEEFLRQLSDGTLRYEWEIAKWGRELSWTDEQGRKTWPGKSLMMHSAWNGKLTL